MKQELSDQELKQIYTLTPDEITLVKRKPEKTRAYFLALYKFYKHYNKFPKDINSISELPLKYIAKQISIKKFNIDNLSDRTKRHILSEIRNVLDIKALTSQTTNNLKNWLISEILPTDHKNDFIKESILKYLASNNIESLSDSEIKKIIKSSLSDFQQKIFKETSFKLNPEFSLSIENWINNYNQPQGLVSLGDIRGISLIRVKRYGLRKFST
jgi:hypothetical protein